MDTSGYGISFCDLKKPKPYSHTITQKTAVVSKTNISSAEFLVFRTGIPLSVKEGRGREGGERERARKGDWEREGVME